MKSNKYDEADKEAVKAIVKTIRNEIRGQVQKALASISTPPREIDVLQTEKRKLEHKMWAALSGEEKLEYIKLFKKVKDAEKKVKDSKISEELDQNFTKPSDDMEDYDSEVWNWLKEHGTEENKQVIMMTARHFADWQKEQMMKDAINAHVFKSYNPVSESPDKSCRGIELLYEYENSNENIPYVKAGDNIKFIIIKDNE